MDDEQFRSIVFAGLLVATVTSSRMMVSREKKSTKNLGEAI